MLLLIQQPTLFATLNFLALLLSSANALQVTPSSPCATQCKSGREGTTGDDVVCKDAEYQSTTNGTRFQNCVECELGSTHVDTTTGDTDVLWGLCMAFTIYRRSGLLTTILLRQSPVCSVDMRVRLSHVETVALDPVSGYLHPDIEGYDSGDLR